MQSALVLERFQRNWTPIWRWNRVKTKELYFSRSIARQPISRRQNPPGQSMASTPHRRAPAPRATVGRSSGDIQHAPARREEPRASRPRAGVSDDDAGDRRRASTSLISVPVNGAARIALRRQHDGERVCVRKARRLLRPARPSTPRASCASRSSSRRGRITCVSGSPKRTLYSMSFGPSGRQHQPAKSTPLKGRALASMARIVGAMIFAITRPRCPASRRRPANRAHAAVFGPVSPSPTRL